MISKIELHRRLVEHSHTFWSEKAGEVEANVWPLPKNIITVGLDPDGTLEPAYRQRYFTCIRDENGLMRIEEDLGFAFPKPFATVAERESVSGDFMYGPMRWLLVRFQKFPRILLWPEGGFRGEDGCGFLINDMMGMRLDEAPRLQRWLRETVPEPAVLGAALLDLSLEWDCEILWEMTDLVARLSYNVYLSDFAANEVYLLHHHDKVVVSLPNNQRREEMLSELTKRPDIFEDCSNYTSDADEEFGW
jgi:hypothetical protein